MGMYIPNTNENLLRIRNTAERVERSIFRAHTPGYDDKYGVALIDNVAFIAIGVAYSEAEAEAFAGIHDGRQVRFVLLPLKDIEEMSPRIAEALQKNA